MRRRVLVPGRRLIASASAIGAVALVSPFVPVLAVLWQVASVTLVLLVLVDILMRPAAGSIVVSREIPPVCHIGRRVEYVTRLYNSSNRFLDVAFRETLPSALEGRPRAAHGTFAPGRTVELRTEIVGLRRGDHALPTPHVRLSQPLGLLEFQEAVAIDDRVSVVPGRPAGETEWLLARAALIEETGRKLTRKRGSDREFESLREYVVGDEPRRIDWSASARRHRPMVRQYQAERNAEVILALDCGRLMGSLVGGVPKVDLAMTPLLDLAAIALRRKERVGFLAFDSEPRAFIPPRGGMNQLNTLIATMASVPSGNEATSYLRAVRYLESRHRKRSMLLILTDFTDEVSAREMEATLTALTKRHVMIFVAVSDTHLEDIFERSREDAPSLFEKAVSGQLLLERTKTLARLERAGVATIDADPMRLSAPMIRKYLELRFRGAL